MSTESAERPERPSTISPHTIEKLRTAGKLAQAMPGSTREEVEHVLEQVGPTPGIEGAITVADVADDAESAAPKRDRHDP